MKIEGRKLAIYEELTHGDSINLMIYITNFYLVVLKQDKHIYLMIFILFTIFLIWD